MTAAKILRPALREAEVEATAEVKVVEPAVIMCTQLVVIVGVELTVGSQKTTTSYTLEY